MKNQIIQKYHFEEIILILLILASDFSLYNDDDLIGFAEDIEGRIDVLFTKESLVGFDAYFQLTDILIDDFEQLRKLVLDLYSPQWHKKLKEITLSNALAVLANKILRELSIEYIEPQKYLKNHLNMD